MESRYQSSADNFWFEIKQELNQINHYLIVLTNIDATDSKKINSMQRASLLHLQTIMNELNHSLSEETLNKNISHFLDVIEENNLPPELIQSIKKIVQLIRADNKSEVNIETARIKRKHSLNDVNKWCTLTTEWLKTMEISESPRSFRRNSDEEDKGPKKFKAC